MSTPPAEGSESTVMLLLLLAKAFPRETKHSWWHQMRYRESFVVAPRCSANYVPEQHNRPNVHNVRLTQCGNASRNISWPVTVSADAACEWASWRDRCLPGAPGPLGGSLPSIPYLTPPSCLLLIFFVPFYRRIIRSPEYFKFVSYRCQVETDTVRSGWTWLSVAWMELVCGT